MRMKRIIVFILLVFIVILHFSAEAEEGLEPQYPIIRLPSPLKIVGEEAFSGIQTDQVFLPEEIITIGSRAFADSSIGRIHLSSSLQFIADDAFDGANLGSVSAEEGTYAYDWAVQHGFIIPEPIECPVSINVTTNAGFGNPGHYHPYGTGRRFAGTISSTIPIWRVRSEVVYRGGERDGESAYDCSRAVVYCEDNPYSIDIRNSNLNTYLKFGSMPCAPLRLYLYAEFDDGSSATIYEYDFEIVRRCNSVSLNYKEKRLKYGTGFFLSPKVGPSNATYMNSFHYESSDPDIVSVDEFGYVQAHHTSGTATITVHTGDWFTYETCTVTVVPSLLDMPQIIDYIAEDSIYDTLDTWIFLNYEEVEGAAYYELSRASSEDGPFSVVSTSDGFDTEYISNPFSDYLFIFDSECEEDTIYYYRLRAKSNGGEYSDYSKVFKANSTVLSWEDIDEEEVWIRVTDILEIPDYVEDDSNGILNISGTLESNHEITHITASIYSYWGTLMTQTVIQPNTKAYSLSNLIFNTASYENGLYKLVIKATAGTETQLVTKKYFSIQYSHATIPTTEQLQNDIVNFVTKHNSSIFNLEEEVESYLANMGSRELVFMALSDYTNVAIKWIRDRLTGTDYNSYMVQKYEAQIIKILDDMYKEGKISSIKLSTPVTNMIKSLNSLTKNTSKVSIDEINEVFTQYEGSNIDWDELENLLIIRDGCEEISDMFDGIKAHEEFINIICELISDHSKDLEALNIVAQYSNPTGDPSFNEAMRRIRISYKTQFGSSLRMIFHKLESELEKEAFKEITKAILTKSAGTLYSLVDTIIQISVKVSGISDAGKNMIDLMAQITALKSLQRAYSNISSEILYNSRNGKLPTETQINHLQVTFQCTRLALIQAYKTMINLDEWNTGIYDYYIKQTEDMTMPGVGRLSDNL